MPESGASGPREPDAVIIGAGPAGLWAAFQLGIHGIRCIILDSNDRVGGQCAALYADKPVYDLPGFAAIDAGNIAVGIAGQLERFQPQILLSYHVSAVRKVDSGFEVATRSGATFSAAFVIVATGLGPFGIDGKPDALQLPASVVRKDGHPVVTAEGFETGCANLYAIGDAIDYPGKLCLLVSAFHEAALVAFAIRKARAGGRRIALEYTSTSSGLKGLFSEE